jgi:CheY-like chemotaxis protein
MALKILVVDDASFIRDLIKKQLRDHLYGVEIFEAVDGVRAMVLLKHNPIDIILSDWEMPLMTGEDLLKQVRASPEGAKTPFVMISSRGDRDHVIKAVQAGVSDYLTKPFSAEELLTKVHKQLKIIGKIPSQQTREVAAQSIASSSLDLLTGGGKPKLFSTPSPTMASAALLMGAAAVKPAPAKPINPGTTVKAKAQLRLADNVIFACDVREMSLQVMSCIMQRSENLPRIFDQTVVDIDMGAEKGLARVNGYVHSIMAGENRPDSASVKMVIRFVDNDVDKFEVLSKFIDQM